MWRLDSTSVALRFKQPAWRLHAPLLKLPLSHYRGCEATYIDDWSINYPYSLRQFPYAKKGLVRNDLSLLKEIRGLRRLPIIPRRYAVQELNIGADSYLAYRNRTYNNWSPACIGVKPYGKEYRRNSSLPVPHVPCTAPYPFQCARIAFSRISEWNAVQSIYDTWKNKL